MQFILAGVAAASMLLASGPVTDHPTLQRAIRAYWNADYTTARDELEAARSDGLREENLVLAHKFLALCAFAENREAEAEKEFLELLRVDPSYRLDSREVAPPVTELFERARRSWIRSEYERGKEAYLREEWSAAAAHFDGVLRADPANDFARVFKKLTVMNL